MAVEKSKVIDRFKSKFGTIGLSSSRLDEISAKLAAKLNDDSTDEQIDERLDELNEIYPFSEIKKNDDRATNDKKNPNRQSAKKDVSADENQKSEEDDKNDPMSLVLKELKDMKDKISAFESEKKQQSIADRFKKDERLKGIPEFVLKRSIPTSEEDYEDSVIELANEYKSFAEKEKLSSYGKDIPGSGKSNSKGDSKKISPEEAKKVVENM